MCFGWFVVTFTHDATCKAFECLRLPHMPSITFQLQYSYWILKILLSTTVCYKSHLEYASSNTFNACILILKMVYFLAHVCIEVLFYTNMGQKVHDVDILPTFVNFVPHSLNTHFRKIANNQWDIGGICASFVFSPIRQEKEQSNFHKYMHYRTARVRTGPNGLRVSHIMRSS